MKPFVPTPAAPIECPPRSPGSALEAYLARLYVDEKVRARFLFDPRNEARRAGLEPSECDDLARLDCVGLELAARSYAAKRKRKSVA